MAAIAEFAVVFNDKRVLADVESEARHVRNVVGILKQLMGERCIAL